MTVIYGTKDRPQLRGVGCMGGWCRLRESCARYVLADRSRPVERLCVPHMDGLLSASGFPVALKVRHPNE